MFSLFARRLPRTTLSAIHLCARGVASEVGPTNAVYVHLRQKANNKISHQRLKDGLAANFGPVERLWLAMPVGNNCIVIFEEQADAQKLMDKGTLEIRPATLTARNFAGPREPETRKLREINYTKKCPRLMLHNVPAQLGISSPEIAKVLGQFGKVSVRHPTYHGYPRRFAFAAFETQEAADKALETIRSEEGIIIEGARLDANYPDNEQQPDGKYRAIIAES
ncbi:hypothetical protein BDZ89DRAFT_1066262 [Hymenopellis radicata]|nr:hypothetical protein BDZ89DRAFT_1066262 [Hymenopellis radicata]